MTIDEIDKLTEEMYMRWLGSRRSEPRDLRREIFLAGHAIAASGVAACAKDAAEWKSRAEKAEAIVAQWRDAYSRNIVVTAIANEEDDEAAHVHALAHAGQIMVEGKA